MKAFRCGDVVPGCVERFVGADEAEVLAQVPEHARTAHGIDEVTPELVTAVRAAVHDVPDV